MATDPLQLGPYIGTMLATSLVTVGIHVVLLRRPYCSVTAGRRSAAS